MFKRLICIAVSVCITGAALGMPSDAGTLQYLQNNTAYTIVKDNYNPNKWYVHFGDSVKHPAYYTNLINFLDSRTSKDMVIMDMQGPGGYAVTMHLLSLVFQETKATLTIVVTGNVSSAHAILAVSGDLLEANPQAQFMFHLPWLAKEDKDGKFIGADYFCREGSESQKPLDKSYCDGVRDFYTNNFKHLFNDFEYDKLMKGYDVYIPAPTIVERFYATADMTMSVSM